MVQNKKDDIVLFWLLNWVPLVTLLLDIRDGYMKHSSTLKIETALSSETLVTIYQATVSQSTNPDCIYDDNDDWKVPIKLLKP
jgi:hypothetical protein